MPIGFKFTVEEAQDTFQLEDRIEQEIKKYRPILESQPDVPLNIRTLSSVAVGDLIIALSSWYDDVICELEAQSERKLRQAKARVETVEAAIRREATQDPELKKSTSGPAITAEIKADLRYVYAEEDSIICESVATYINNKAKACRRMIDTISRIITQQVTEIDAGKFRNGRPGFISQRSPVAQYPSGDPSST